MWTGPTADPLTDDENTRPLSLPTDEDPGLWVGIEVSDRCPIDGHINTNGEAEFNLGGRSARTRICLAPNALHRFAVLASRLDRSK